MKSQPHPYDRRELKEVLHRNELAEDIKEARDWAQNHLEIVLVLVLLVAALVFGVYYFLNGRKQGALASSLLLSQAQEAYAHTSGGVTSQTTAAYAEAYVKYQSLVSTYPGSLEFRAAQLGMANCDLGLSKAAVAQKEYAALDDGKADPISALAALGEARALEAQGKPADARAAYAAVLARYPGSAVVGQAEAGRAALAGVTSLPAVASPAPSAPQPSTSALLAAPPTAVAPSLSPVP